MQKKLHFFILILLIGSLGQVAADLYLPSLPAIQTALHTSTTLVQYSVSAYMIGFALSQLPYGPISDAIGRKKPLLFGLSLLMIGTMVCVTATSIQQIIVGRLLQGLGGGAGITLTRIMLRDCFSGIKLAKAASYAAGGRVAIMAGAPFIGGLIQHYAHWQANFIAIGLYTLIMIVAILIWLPETNQNQKNFTIKNFLLNSKKILSNRLFLSMSFILAIIYGNILAWLTAGPILLQVRAGLSAIDFGLTALLCGIAAGLGALTNGRIVGYFKIRHMLAAGLTVVLIGAVSMLVMGLNSHRIVTWQIVAPMCLIMYGGSITFGNTITTALGPFKQLAGTAGSLSGLIQITGGALASAIIAHLPETTQLPLAITITSATLLASVIFLGCRKQIN